MPRLSELSKDYAQRFGIEPSRVNGMARYLREAGLLTQGARGVNAPDATMLDASRLLLAVMGGISEPANKAPDVVRALGQATSKPKKGGKQGPPIFGVTLEDGLANLLEYFGRELTESEFTRYDIELAVVPPSYAAINIRDGKRHEALAALEATAEMDEGAAFAHLAHHYPRPRGLRHEVSVGELHIIAIAQIVAGLQPIGWGADL